MKYLILLALVCGCATAPLSKREYGFPPQMAPEVSKAVISADTARSVDPNADCCEIGNTICCNNPEAEKGNECLCD